MERVQLIQARLPRLLRFGRRIFVAGDVLIGRFTKEGMPIRKCGWIGHNCGKPIVEGHMELRSDGSGLEIEDQGNRT
jgi:hypothetical protein